jgi:hypothetical protein
MPSVAASLRHAEAAERIVCEAYPEGMDAQARHHALALENVVVQLSNLRTHPSVAAGLARGALRLHGWFFEIETSALLACDGGRALPADRGGRHAGGPGFVRRQPPAGGVSFPASPAAARPARAPVFRRPRDALPPTGAIFKTG